MARTRNHILMLLAVMCLGFIFGMLLRFCVKSEPGRCGVEEVDVQKSSVEPTQLFQQVRLDLLTHAGNPDVPSIPSYTPESIERTHDEAPEPPPSNADAASGGTRESSN
jgi:hypothetical protein